MRKKENIKIKFSNSNTLTVIFSAVFFALIFVIVVKLGVMSVYATKGDNIVELESKRTELIQENKSLETEIAYYQSLTYIEQQAKDRLGMIKMQTVKYIDVK